METTHQFQAAGGNQLPFITIKFNCLPVFFPSALSNGWSDCCQYCLFIRTKLFYHLFQGPGNNAFYSPLPTSMNHPNYLFNGINQYNGNTICCHYPYGNTILICNYSIC